MLARVAERVFPTLTEPLRSREDMRRLIGDDAAWSALFEEPLSELVERAFADDLARGTVLTDALIGTFAPADDPLLRQNRCFLYHVVGGPWNVPVGGMGALTDGLASAARDAGAALVTGAEVASIATDGRAAEVTCADGRVYWARHVLAGVAPHVLAGLLGEPARRRQARGRPAQDQHAALPPAARLRGQLRGRLHRHVPRQRGLSSSSTPPTGRRPPARSQRCRRVRSTATR